MNRRKTFRATRPCSVAYARAALLTLLLAPAALSAQAPGGPEADIIREITRLDDAWLNAGLTRDVDTVADLLHDDFRGQIGDRLVDKEAMLSGVAASTRVDLTLDRLEVFVFGDVATAHAVRTSTDRASDGTLVTERFAYTDVYRWNGTRWLAISGQSAALPPTP